MKSVTERQRQGTQRDHPQYKVRVAGVGIWPRKSDTCKPFQMPGFESQALGPDSVFLLVQTLGGSHEGSSHWIIATM